MITVKDPRWLPNEILRFALTTQAEAQKNTTQYQAVWFYQLPRSDKGYVYVLDSEYQKKQQERKS